MIFVVFDKDLSFPLKQQEKLEKLD